MHLLLSMVWKGCHQGPVPAQSAPTCLPSLLLQLSISALQLLKHGLLCLIPVAVLQCHLHTNESPLLVRL